MPSPFRSIGRFSQRLSAGLGGNRNAGGGLFEEFPLIPGHVNSLQYFSHYNDFMQASDYDATNDWVATDIGAHGDQAGALQKDGLAGSAFGVVRLSAGTADSTGWSSTRSPSGSNIANMIPVDLVTNTPTTGILSTVQPTRYRFAFGCRFRITETGTANQSAFTIALARDEAATTTTAGVLGGAVSHFGFTKTLATATPLLYSRTSANATTAMNAIVPGTSLTTGTYVELALVGELRSTSQFVLEGYQNRVKVATLTTTASTSTPTADLYSPHFSVVNGVGADATLDIDYYWCLSQRY